MIHSQFYFLSCSCIQSSQFLGDFSCCLPSNRWECVSMFVA